MQNLPTEEPATYVDQVILAAASGLTLAEVGWMYRRLSNLKEQGKTKEESRVIVMREAPLRPWLQS